MDVRGKWRELYLMLETFKEEPVRVFVAEDNGFTDFDGTSFHAIAHVQYFELPDADNVGIIRPSDIEAHHQRSLLLGFIRGCFDYNTVDNLDMKEMRTHWNWEPTSDVSEFVCSGAFNK